MRCGAVRLGPGSSFNHHPHGGICSLQFSFINFKGKHGEEPECGGICIGQLSHE